MDEPEISLSVIVPAYNCEKTVQKCVLSVLANRKDACSDMEVLVVDDGSLDGTPEILDRLAALKPEVKIIHKPNGGVSSARNAGLDAARGEFVYFIDSDDFIVPGVLPQVVAHMAACGIDCCRFCIGHEISETEADKISLDNLDPCGNLEFTAAKPANECLTFKRLLWNHSLCESVFRRSIIEDASIRSHPDIIFSEDELLLNTFYAQNPHICDVVDPGVIYYYVQQPTSIMHSQRPEMLIKKNVSRFASAKALLALAHHMDNDLKASDHYRFLLSESNWYAYVFFAQCLTERHSAPSLAFVLSCLEEAAEIGLLPLTDFTREPFFPSSLHNKLLIRLINHPRLFRAALRLKYLFGVQALAH